MAELYLYLGAVFNNWVLYMTAGPFIIDEMVKRIFPSWRTRFGEIFPKSLRRKLEVALVIIGVFWAGFQAFKVEHQARITAEGSSRPNEIPYGVLTNAVAQATSTARIEKERADQEHANFEGAAAMVVKISASANAHPSYPVLKDIHEQLARAWTNIPSDKTTIEQLYIHAQQDAILTKAEDNAKKHDDLQSSLIVIYPFWETTISKFKERLSEPAKQIGGKVDAGALPSIEDIIETGRTNTYITLGTNSTWQGRCEFGQDCFYLECTGKNGVRSYVRIWASGNQLAVNLMSDHKNSGGQAYLLATTNCPLSSYLGCSSALNRMLDLLFKDQDGQF